jgi:nucleoside-diphosphate-sugar epimerase
MPRALILGGTGAIGRATAKRLLAAGWRVDLTGRDAGHMPSDLAGAGARFMSADRDDPDQLLADVVDVVDGVDLLVDCTCFTAEHATRLLPLARNAGSTVMISSKAVYVDAAGNHSNSVVAPRFDGPIDETQPTLAPGDSDYRSREGYGANKVAAEQVLLGSGLPVTVLRPSKIHGQGATPPREWVFVKRVLDRRPALLLSRRGSGVDHPSAAANIAALIERVAAAPGRRILNSADPDAPSALQISRIIAAQLNHDWLEVLLESEGDGENGVAHADGAEQSGAPLGGHPWERPYPIVLDTRAARGLGYAQAGDYATTVAEEVRWLLAAARNSSGPDLFPGFDHAFFDPYFDYAAEDRYLTSHPD